MTIAPNRSYSEDHTLEMVFTRKNARAGVNPESPPINQPETNICKVITLSHTVFTQEQNELFVQKVVQ